MEGGASSEDGASVEAGVLQSFFERLRLKTYERNNLKNQRLQNNLENHAVLPAVLAGRGGGGGMSAASISTMAESCPEKRSDGQSD
eukprot:COSAG02_NODE_4288_length_5545_cov_8.284613_5_plen_86_part_00